MPKIKDLGINIVPGTMRPPEIGGGGGCGGATLNMSQCDCISNMCLPNSAMAGAQNFGVSDCNCVSFAQQRVGGAQGGPNPNPTYTPFCSQCDCISNWDRTCTCSHKTPHCIAGSHGTTITPHTPNLAGGVLSRQDIADLRAQLKQALDNLDVAEKNLLPKTVEEIDAREKELQRELDALKARRNELKK